MTLEEFEAMMRQDIGIPVETAVKDAGKSVDSRFNQLKQVLSAPKPQSEELPVMQSMPKLGPLGEQPGDERVAPLQKDFNPSQVRALEQMDALKRRDALMKQQLEREAATQAQSEAEFDPASYEEVKPGRFSNIKNKLK